MTTREMVAFSVQHFEGGFVDHPDDRGGRTNHGLTWAVFQEEYPRSTLDAFLALTTDDVIDMLCERYALKPGFWRIANLDLRHAVIDYAIHSGVSAATKALQKAAGVHVDGQLGPQTTAAVNAANPAQLEMTLTAIRLRLWARLFQQKPSQRVFAAGWLNRAARLLEESAA